MVMIDKLVRSGTDSAAATQTFEPDSYGVSGDVVLEPTLIECLAQTVAAAYGYDAVRLGRQPAMGMLVGVSDFQIYRHAVHSRKLELTVELKKQLGPLCLMEGRVRQNGHVVAEGTLKFYIEETNG